MRHIDISVFAIEILFFNQIFCVVYTSKPYYMETFSFRITSYFLIKISKAFFSFHFSVYTITNSLLQSKFNIHGSLSAPIRPRTSTGTIVNAYKAPLLTTRHRLHFMGSRSAFMSPTFFQSLKSFGTIECACANSHENNS